MQTANRRQVRLVAALTGMAILAAFFAAWRWRPRPVEPPDRPAPLEFQALSPVAASLGDYVSSQACRDCHPDHHASWHASYHRTMTQVASPSAVIGDFDDAHVTAEGRSYHLHRRDERYWVEMDDPDFVGAGAPRIERPIVMTTGSHHMQVCWYSTGHSRVVGQLPLIYLRETKNWIPRDSAFLMPPNEPFAAETGRWNETCSRCHTTSPRSLPMEQGGWNTKVAEFGISCEACHGPGRAHVALHQTSGRSKRNDPDQEDPIINPATLPHRRNSQVCGQCHGITIAKDYESSLKDGYAFRPGHELSRTTHEVRNDQPTREFLKEFLVEEGIDDFLLESFWPDGMVRVSGREYNGLLETPCYQNGELSCLSCHTMHKAADDPRTLSEWTNDQLNVGMDSDGGCIQCHSGNQYGTAHTHHAADSAGARCYNCHMPHTTYGLLKAIRSHTITSPNLSVDLPAGRPNACNLCHLDQTLAWTADHLDDWYEMSSPALDEDQRTVAASLLSLLRGDAGQRALSAWSMGWSPALTTSGSDWQAPFLATLLEDPYDAVRFIAYRSLQRQIGFDEFNYDFVGPASDRQRAREQARKIWSQLKPPAAPGRRVLMDQEGVLQLEKLNQLLLLRDDRSINLSE